MTSCSAPDNEVVLLRNVRTHSWEARTCTNQAAHARPQSTWYVHSRWLELDAQSVGAYPTRGIQHKQTKERRKETQVCLFIYLALFFILYARVYAAPDSFEKELTVSNYTTEYWWRSGYVTAVKVVDLDMTQYKYIYIYIYRLKRNVKLKLHQMPVAEQSTTDLPTMQVKTIQNRDDC